MVKIHEDKFYWRRYTDDSQTDERMFKIISQKGHAKLKPQWDITKHTRISLKNSDNTKCWQGWGETGSLVHCWWEWKYHRTTLEKSLEVYYKTNHLITIRPSKYCRHLSQKWKLCSCKNLFMHVHRSFVCNSRNV